MFDISTDYLNFDFLETVEYFSATGENTWTDGVTVNNCTFFGFVKAISEDDLRRTHSSLVVRQPEWSITAGLSASGPQRGDKFTFGGTTYFVERVASDLVRLMQWVLTCYAI